MKEQIENEVVTRLAKKFSTTYSFRSKEIVSECIHRLGGLERLLSDELNDDDEINFNYTFNINRFYLIMIVAEIENKKTGFWRKWYEKICTRFLY